MRTLVTGGAGFIGRHLVDRLLADGDDVVVIDSLETQVHDGRAPVLSDIAFVQGTVGDESAVDRALVGVDRVVHLAAAVGVGQSMYEIAEYVRRNTMDTASFLERLVHTKHRPARLVVASSMSLYGEGEYECPEHGAVAPAPRPEAQLAARNWELSCSECEATLSPRGTRETKLPMPTSVYAVTKRDHEDLCLVIGAAYGIPSVALRFFNVYGPGQSLSNPYTGVAAIFASRLLNRRPPVIFEDGHQSRDFIYVTDIVEGIVRALESEPATGHAINLGTGRSTTVNDVASVLARGLELDLEPERREQYRAGDIRHCFADPTLAEALLGFRAAVTLEQGMTQLIEWLDDQDAVDKVEAATEELVARGLAR